MIESDERQQQDTLRTSELVARTEAKLLILEQRDRDNAWSMLARSAEQPKGSSPYHRKARSISTQGRPGRWFTAGGASCHPASLAWKDASASATACAASTPTGSRSPAAS